MSRLRFIALAVVAGMALVTVVVAAPVKPTTGAANRDIERMRSLQRRSFTDAEISDGFFKTSFGSELQRGDTANRIRKYDGRCGYSSTIADVPTGGVSSPKSSTIFAQRSTHIDLALTTKREEANVTVTLVPEREFAQTLRAHYGNEQADKIQRSLEPQCLAGLAKDASYRILHSDVFLVVDAGNFVFSDCGYEEILQALGPINDDNSVPWTMFNDNVSLGFFGIYDQLLLNILYHPRVKPGMTREEVANVTARSASRGARFRCAQQSKEPVATLHLPPDARGRIRPDRRRACPSGSADDQTAKPMPEDCCDACRRA